MSDAIESLPRLLIVDDEKTNLVLLQQALNMEYAITTAKDGAEALRAARATPRPDLILLDVMMPAPNGFAVCQQLKADPATADIPVIFVTSMTDNINEQVGLQLGAVDYINKPISPPVVRARVALHLRLKLQNEFLQRLLDQRTKDLESARAEARTLLKPR
jgi:response regulator RpfG family c-di-GMP phosphodiesterase